MSTKRDRTKEELGQELNTVTAKAKAKDVVSAKEKAARAAQAAATKGAVSGLTVEKAVQAVTTTGLTIQKTLSAVTEELTLKTVELDRVNEAIKIAEEELAEVHGKEVLATSIDQLVAEHDAKVKQLDGDIAAKRAAWSDEQAQHAKAVAERNAEIEKNRKRDDDAYNYTTAQRRKGEEDVWTEKVRVMQAQERDRQEKQTKDWNEREAALKARENELADYKLKVEKFPAELDAAVKKAEAIVGNAMKREHAHEVALLNKDSESAKNLLTMQVAQAQAEQQRLQQQVAQLQAQLVEASNKNVELAKAALDAASGRQALLEVRDLQGTRADNGSTGSRNKS